MNLVIIVAISKNNIIGNKGTIPWYIPEDIKRFKNLTLNHPVIMGRKTYESIPKKFRPLPQRKNIVLSRNFESNENICIARNIEEALKLTEEKKSYIIGGGEIYKIFLPLANRMEITRINLNYLGDSFFPEVNWKRWNLINKEEKISRSGIPYSFMSYVRK